VRIGIFRWCPRADGKAPVAATPPPRLGQDNENVWAELGLSSEDLRQLKEEGVL